jgi:hypothetical protein
MTENTGEKGVIKKKTDWTRFISIFLPVVIIIGFTIVFSGSSSSSDCGDCSSSSADLEGVCGAPINLDKSGQIRFPGSVSMKSAQTDMRCGYGVSWSYKWVNAKKTPKKPSVNIAVSASRGGSGKVNSSDSGGDNGWAGTYVIARGSGDTPVLGTISVTASSSDPTTLLDPISVSLHLIYSSVKK